MTTRTSILSPVTAALIALGAFATSACALSSEAPTTRQSSTELNAGSGQGSDDATATNEGLGFRDARPDGDGCAENWECQSGFCSNFTCMERPASETMNGGEGLGYLQGHANGDGCSDNWECQSGICTNFVCVARPQNATASDEGLGYLQGHANGEGCSESWECLSGWCADSICVPRPENATQNGGKGLGSQDARPNGDGCAEDWECQSGFCNDEWLCTATNSDG